VLVHKRRSKISKKVEKQHKLDNQIKAHKVCLIGNDGKKIADEILLWQAVELAHSQGMRLVEINGQSVPPVCRIMDYGKFVFQQNKNKKTQKKVPKLKEIKLRPVTDEGDFQVKLRNLITFLEKGDKVKVTLKFRGREIAHQELADRLFQRIVEATAIIGHIDSHPKLEGKQIMMSLSPKGQN
jgi:translation initiation factor IF-3